MRRFLMISALLAGLVAIAAGDAYAQQYRTDMLIPGIPGASTDTGHKDWIEVLSISQGVSVPKRSVACSDVSIMKVLDQAGPMLWAAAAGRQLFPEVRIEVVLQGIVPGGHVVYDIRLNNARVTSTQTSGSSELPTESVSFSYDSVTLTFNALDNRTGHPIPGTPQTIACQ